MESECYITSEASIIIIDSSHWPMSTTSFLARLTEFARANLTQIGTAMFTLFKLVPTPKPWRLLNETFETSFLGSIVNVVLYNN